jgi:hypothetical protein
MPSCSKPSAGDLSTAPAPPGVQFTDVTARAGIRFQHVNGARGRKYMPETMGSGCAFLDLDNDGWLDILLLNGKPLEPEGAADGGPPTLALYRNNRDGTFSDVTRGSGLDVPLYGMGCCVGDFDNDGWPDLFITAALEPSRLFRNQGNGTFRDVTQRAGVSDPRWGSSCAWVDFDNDGWLDLFVGSYVRYRSLAEDRWCSLREGQKSYCTPEVYDGEACRLYRNRGDGTFADVSRETGIGVPLGKALGVTLLDYDGDGWMDIAVANDERPNFLFHNVPAPGGGPHGRRFAEIGMRSGLGLDASGLTKASMGIDAADIRNDGRLQLLISSFSNEGLSFYTQEASDLFAERGFQVGLGQPSYLLLGFGLFFFDFDNDGWQDAFVANGHVQDDIQLLQNTVTYAERPLLFRNLGNGRFAEIGQRSGAPFSVERVSRGAAYGDFDNDGDLDILLTNNHGPAVLLRNDGGNAQAWLQVEVRGGHGANRDAIGALVTLQASGQTQRRWVRSGSSYLSESMRRLHFGLGHANRVERLVVRFPDGRVWERRDLPANQKLLVEE